MKHIAIILPVFDEGGGEAFISTLTSCLVTGGYRFTIICFQSKPSHFKERVSKICQFIDLGQRSRFRYALPALTMRLGQTLSCVKPDIVLSILGEWNFVLAACSLFGWVRSPILAGEHGSLKGSMDLIQSSIWRKTRVTLMYRIIYPWLVECFVPCSMALAEELRTQFGVDIAQLKPISNMVDISRVSEMSREPISETCSADKRPLFLAVGRMIEHKAYDRLIRAYAEVERGISARLTFVGDGPTRSRLEKQVQDLGLKTVEFVGYQANPYKYMAAATALVSSSLSEGFPITFIEALSLGLPVVATDCPVGPREILQGGKEFCGVLVPLGDSEALARAMTVIGTDSALRMSLSIAARERAKDFALEKGIREYTRLFESYGSPPVS